MRIVVSYVLQITQISSSLSIIYFIEGKAFDILNATMKVFIFLYLVRSKLYIVLIAGNVILRSVFLKRFVTFVVSGL
jgi:hypothetical protein